MGVNKREKVAQHVNDSELIGKMGHFKSYYMGLRDSHSFYLKDKSRTVLTLYTSLRENT